MTVAVVERLVDAINDRDLVAMVDCFAETYACEWPAHPGRSFRGREHVRRNWEARFAAQPVIRASVTTSAQFGDENWGEWEFTCEDHDGTPLRQTGVIIFLVAGEVIIGSRFYMETVEPADSRTRA